MIMLPLSQIFTFLFLMLGPFKIIGPFAKITKEADKSFTQKLAIRAILVSSAALLLAAIIGKMMLKNLGIPVQILAISGGLILFLVALMNVIKQFSPLAPHDAQAEPPTMEMAIYPLAFPTIVTPYGIAAVIVFMSISPDLKSSLIIGAIVLLIMVLNLVLMLITRHIYKSLAIVLVLLGAILGVIQVALGFMFVYNQFRGLLAL
jgi:multiple antibiotic resistance protein